MSCTRELTLLWSKVPKAVFFEGVQQMEVKNIQKRGHITHMNG